MCGLVGFLGAHPAQTADGASTVLRRMADAILHRGPDDEGYWLEGDQQIALGFRRLSIVDLSPAGHQPMQAASGRYVIAYNGEIYNHRQLREELESTGCAPVWRGRSDTETLLACIDAWGIRGALERVVGMFAFALWDRQTCVLTLARDRLGEKPVYYGWQGDVFLFGSELKALRTHPAFRNEIDRGALGLLLRHNAISSPYSIYQDIAKLPPGCMLTVSLKQRVPDVTTYWSGASAAESGVADPFSGSDEQAVDQLEALLKDAIGRQMVADVPLGAFLSGGVDSSTVVALMQAQSSRPVKTFTIGFHEDSYNEGGYAKAVAAHLGTDHSELYVTPQQAIDVVSRLPNLYDEPFADSSQIPTFLVSQLARQQVTVSLSGDGGDELFCGYNRYLLTQRMWGVMSALPYFLRNTIAAGLAGISPTTWNRTTAPLMRLAPQRLRVVEVGDKLHKLAGVLGAVSPAELYRKLTSHWPNPYAVVLGASEPPAAQVSSMLRLTGLSPVQRMMATDMLTYLPDDILVKVDRASMGVSLESRLPFLDHRVVEFAWRLPQTMKLRNGQTKWALRQVLYRYVPRNLIERSKMGFGIPIGAWLRGPLREWAEALLDESRLKAEGYFDPAPIRAKWSEHLSMRRNWQYQLWSVLMFQAWLEHEKSRSTSQWTTT